MDQAGNRRYGGLFNPANFICGEEGGANNWAIGYKQEGPTLIDQVMEIFRQEAEAC